MTKLPLIYIAGPFRGATPLDVRRNVEAARDLGLRVAQAGGYPVIPHTMTSEFDKQLTDEFWLAGTMEMLRRCDAVCLTRNWHLSTGAKAEVIEAKRLHLPIFYAEDDDQVLQEWFLTRWVIAWKDNRAAELSAT